MNNKIAKSSIHLQGKIPAALLLLCTTLFSQDVIPVGLGSYAASLPSSVIAPTNSAGQYLDPAITANLAGRPIPTNDWASSLVFQRNPARPHPLPMFAHPWVIEANENGLRLGSAAGVGISASAFVFGTSWDIQVAIPGQSNTATRMDAHSDWTVSAALYGENLKATFGHGLPYVYIQRSGSIALRLPGVPTVQDNSNGVVAFSIGDRFYAAYAPSSATWTVSGQELSADLGPEGYLSIATLPNGESSTRELFLRHAYAFVTDTRVEWSYDSTAGLSRASYLFETQARQGSELNTLFALYPHQWRTATAADYTGHEYRSPRGQMHLAQGRTFATATPLPGLFPIIPFAAPNDPRYDANTMNSLLQQWGSRSDDQLVRRRADTYWTGKDLGRLAILTQLAEAAGNTALRDRFLTLLRTRLEGWLTYTPGETNECFAYQNTWKTLIGLQASYGSGDELNDHHFHYGYFVMAAATVARMLPGWGAPDQWGGMVNLIAREVSNPERASDFSPFLRTFDIYAGHSWAAGHANFGDGNNQESSSESLNYSAGLVMWGMATDNTTWRDLGTYLYATEVQSVREYWFDVHNENYPAAWTKNAAGMVWGGKVDYATWFSGEPEMIHGINWLPLTGASLFMGIDPVYAGENYDLLVQQNGGEANQWVDVVWGYRAFSNVDDAWRMLQANPGYTPEDGESQPHTYAHILSLGALGNLDTAVRADIPTGAVFRKDNRITYAAYNPSPTPRTVHFTDGRTLSVPAGEWRMAEQGDLVSVQMRIRSAAGAQGSIHPRIWDLLGRAPRP